MNLLFAVPSGAKRCQDLVDLDVEPEVKKAALDLLVRRVVLSDKEPMDHVPTSHRRLDCGRGVRLSVH